jgi:membrane protein implicated in regulation of membrane protease activity
MPNYMFPFDWQTIVAVSIVALASMYLVWRFVGKRQSNCGSGCHSCSSKSGGVKVRAIVQIGEHPQSLPNKKKSG